MTSYRNPSTVLAMRIGLAVLVVIGVTAGVSGRILAGIGLLLVAVFGMRPRLSINEAGVTVVNIRTTSLSWAQIDDVRFGSRLGIERLVLQTSDRALPSWAVSVGRAGGRAWCVDTCRTVQARWHEATGHMPSDPL